jgi:hypothetical protein
MKMNDYVAKNVRYQNFVDNRRHSHFVICIRDKIISMKTNEHNLTVDRSPSNLIVENYCFQNVQIDCYIQNYRIDLVD